MEAKQLQPGKSKKRKWQQQGKETKPSRLTIQRKFRKSGLVLSVGWQPCARRTWILIEGRKHEAKWDQLKASDLLDLEVRDVLESKLLLKDTCCLHSFQISSCCCYISSMGWKKLQNFQTEISGLAGVCDQIIDTMLGLVSVYGIMWIIQCPTVGLGSS